MFQQIFEVDENVMMYIDLNKYLNDIRLSEGLTIYEFDDCYILVFGNSGYDENEIVDLVDSLE